MPKNKELEKILSMKQLKGLVKETDTLDKCHFVLIVNPICYNKSTFITKDKYYALVERDGPPTEKNYYLVNSNPRNSALNNRSLLSNKQMSIFMV